MDHLRVVPPPDNATSTTVFESSSNLDTLTPSNPSSLSPTTETTVKLLRKYYIMNTVPYLSVSWCYLGNKHVYHVFGLDPFYWLVVFSVGTLYSNVFLTGLIFLFWGCVILYTFQETPRLRNADDDSDSSSDESDSEITEEDPHHAYSSGFLPRRHSTVMKSSSVPPGGTVKQQQQHQQQQQQRQQEGLRRRPTAMHTPENIDDEIKDMMLFS